LFAFVLKCMYGPSQYISHSNMDATFVDFQYISFIILNIYDLHYEIKYIYRFYVCVCVLCVVCMVCVCVCACACVCACVCVLCVVCCNAFWCMGSCSTACYVCIYITCWFGFPIKLLNSRTLEYTTVYACIASINTL
jgi:hypothetical protein